MSAISFSLLPSQYVPSNVENQPVPTECIYAKTLKNQLPHQYLKLRNGEECVVKQFPLVQEPWTNHHFPEMFLLTLEKGKIFGRQGVVLTQANQVIAETAQEWKPAEEHPIFQRTSMPPLKHIKGAVAAITAKGSACYYHWMFEILPRLHLLKESRCSFDYIYLDSNNPFQAYKKETIEHLGIDPKQIIFGDQYTYIQADTVFVPSLPNTVCCTHPLWVCTFLRETFLPKEFKNRYPKYLFIARKSASTETNKRFIVNEEQAFSYLQQKGFEKIYLEDLSVLEQAELFSQAKVVVAAHGAGLSNLVFCEPKTLVFEIFHPDHLDETYWFLSDQLDLQHTCLLSETNKLSSSDNALKNIHLPLVELKARLDNIIS